MCVQYEINQPMGFRDLLRKQNADRRTADRTDIRGDANNSATITATYYFLQIIRFDNRPLRFLFANLICFNSN